MTEGEVVCGKCNLVIAFARTSKKEEVTKITFVCPCGNEEMRIFTSIPFVGGSEECYINYLDESKFECLRR